jgi:exportin-2 (importin alpha re-exporter)
MEARNDVLVSKAMAFLTSVVKYERHRALFETPGVLDSICGQIIIPNMGLRGKIPRLMGRIGRGVI